MRNASIFITSCHFQINHFYYFTSLYGLQDVKNHCAHLRDIELKTGRKIPYLRFPQVLFSLYDSIGEHEITKLKKKYLLRIQKKKDTKISKKVWATFVHT